jgi:hypothetical protein
VTAGPLTPPASRPYSLRPWTRRRTYGKTRWTRRRTYGKRECNGHPTQRLANGVNRATGPAAPSGRDAAGRFQPGCAPGPGNPYARHAARLKHQLLQAADDAGAVRRIVEALLRRVE